MATLKEIKENPDKFIADVLAISNQREDVSVDEQLLFFKSKQDLLIKRLIQYLQAINSSLADSICRSIYLTEDECSFYLESPSSINDIDNVAIPLRYLNLNQVDWEKFLEKEIQTIKENKLKEDLKYKTFNISDFVKIKLNEAGYNYLTEKISKEDLESRIDSEGYIRLQGWDFINVFGGTLGFGKQLLFDLNILIEITNDSYSKEEKDIEDIKIYGCPNTGR